MKHTKKLLSLLLVLCLILSLSCTAFAADEAKPLTGKTVIHPNQIPVVNEMLRVSQQDYADARAILNWDTGSGSLVSASEDGGRMNEYNTHSRWARRILLRAERYGVRA